MKTQIVRSGVAALALGAVLVSATGLPAKADTTSTLLTGAAAAAAAFTLYNIEHKDSLANTVQGHLANGATVYEDGHVVLPNGQTWYPGNNGQTVACNNQFCTINGGNGNGYYGQNGWNNNNRYNSYNNGNYRYNNGNYAYANRVYANNTAYRYNNGYRYTNTARVQNNPHNDRWHH